MSKNRRTQKFLDRYLSEFDFIRKSRKGEGYAFCCICNIDINIAHGGRTDIVLHSKALKHISQYKVVQQTSKLNFLPVASGDQQTIRAEVLFSSFILEHNIPIAAADHVSKLLTAMFPNSPDVKKYACGRTKTSQIIKEIASDSTKSMVNALKSSCFTVATDGSNDSHNQLYPIVVTYFDKTVGEVCCKLLSLPCLEKRDSTGENIAILIKDEFDKFSIPWQNCIALSCDNANVMIGKKKGVGSFLREKQENLVVWGCVCHLLNLAAEKGASVLPISFDDLLVDIFYYLKRSSKRKECLKGFQELHNDESKQILKHCATRWLSLGKCLGRLLDQWDGVMFYFKEECSKSENMKQQFSPRIAAYRIPKMKDVVSDSSSIKRKVESKGKESKKIKLDRPREKKEVSLQPIPKMSEVNPSSACKKSAIAETKFQKSVLSREERIFFCLSSQLYRALAFFLKNIITVFDKFNINLQSEAPRVHKLKSEIKVFFSDLLSRIVKLQVIKSSTSVFHVSYNNPTNHKDDKDISVGSQTTECLKNLSTEETKEFFVFVKKYLCTSCDYIINKFPINSCLLENAEVADITKRDNVKFSSIKFFLDKFPSLLQKDSTETIFEAIDSVEAEFLHYQIATLPEEIFEASRADVQWVMLSKLKDPLSKYLYAKLSTVMLGILTLPHSNAACERVFSQVKKNKTEFRSSMNISTLQSILIAKSHMNGPCFNQVYDATFLKRAKSATYVSLNQNCNS